VDVADRRAWEHDLVRAYYQTVCAGGVDGYSFDQCWEDYRLGIFRPLHRLVVAGAGLDFSSERASALFAALCERCDALLEDHQVGDLLRD
jgi:hypothetical protein